MRFVWHCSSYDGSPSNGIGAVGNSGPLPYTPDFLRGESTYVHRFRDAPDSRDYAVAG